MSTTTIPAEVQKALDARIAEAVEKAISSRASATPVPAPVITSVAKATELTPVQKFGLRLQNEYVQKFGAVDPRLNERTKNLIVKAAGALAGTSGSGGSLLPAEYSDEIIPVLYETSVLLAAGAVKYTYANSLTIGRMNQGVTLQWVAEGGSAAASTVSTDAVTLGAKNLSGYIQASNGMLRAPGVDAAGALAADVLGAMSAEVDAQFLTGDGTANKPAGIISQLNASQSFAANATVSAVNVRKDLAKAMKLVRQSKLAIGPNSPAWIMNAAAFFGLVSMRDNAGNAFASLESETPTLFGVPVYVTEAVDDKVLFVLAKQIGYGIALDSNVGMGLNGTDLVSDCTTVYGRFIGDSKIKHDKAGAVITGTNAWGA